MPIEIKELVIKAVVEDQECSDAKDSADPCDGDSTQGVQAVTHEVMRALRRSQER